MKKVQIIDWYTVIKNKSGFDFQNKTFEARSFTFTNKLNI